MGQLRQLNLWGEWEYVDAPDIPIAKKSKQEIFEDYEAFVAKFSKDAPKTTDDCFTPQSVYEAVLDWLRSKVDVAGRCIVRPFYPGGDYVNLEYPDNCIVVDNPPFSILADIVRFYLQNGIDYFLFAPGLTLFSSTPASNCDIIIKTSITYANGAQVATGFKSNLFPGTKILLASSLEDKIRLAVSKNKSDKRSPVYPPQVVSSALLRKFVVGEDLEIKANECHYIRTLDAQQKTTIFGNGYIVATQISDKLFNKCPEFIKVPTISFSERELKMLQKLNEEYDNNQKESKATRQNKT